MNRKTLKLIIAVLLINLSGYNLLAVEPPRPGEGRQACGGDAVTHCSYYILGQQHKIQACLEEHINEVSPTCQAFLGRVAIFQKGLNQNCGTDVSKHCDSARGKPEEMRSCLRSNLNQFTPTCQNFLNQIASK